MMMMRRAPVLLSSRHISRALSSPTSTTGAAAAADKAAFRVALYGTVTSASANPRSTAPAWNAPAVGPAARSGSARLGLAGSLSLSMALVTAAEAKEPPSPDLLPKEVVLYQYEACPFCNKVKAFLDYHAIPYKVVEVNPLSKKEIKWSEYKKVPILVVDGEQLVDSSADWDVKLEIGQYRLIDGTEPDLQKIIKKRCCTGSWCAIIKNLSSRIQPKKSVLQSEEEIKWFRWVDEHLVHMLSPNIYRSTSEALESFDYITNSGNFSWLERCTSKYAGAAIMYVVSMKLKKKYNITDERAALYDAAETWIKALDGRDFLGGSKPNLADLAVFGVLRPIRHLSAGKDMVQNTRIGEWFQRMESAVGKSSRIES